MSLAVAKAEHLELEALLGSGADRHQVVWALRDARYLRVSLVRGRRMVVEDNAVGNRQRAKVWFGA